MANTIVSQNLSPGSTIQKGSGTAQATPSGILNTRSTLVGTAADTNETDVFTYTIPANTINTDGQIVRLVAEGSFGNDANNKTLKAYWNGTAIATFGPTASTASWRIELTVIRSSSSNAKCKAFAVYSTTTGTGGNLAVTSDFTTALIIKVTGTNGTALAHDVDCDFGRVEMLN